MLADKRSTLWVVRRGSKTHECAAQLFGNGQIEIELISNGFAICAQMFQTAEEAMAFSEEHRARFQGKTVV